MAFSSPISIPGLEEAQLQLQRQQNNQQGSNGGTSFQHVLNQELNSSIFSMLSLYQDKSVSVVDRNGQTIGNYRVDEIIKKGNNYQFNMVDPSIENDRGFRANVVFEYSKENALYSETLLPSDIRDRELRQRFEVEKYLSLATKTLAADGDIDPGSIALPSLPPEQSDLQKKYTQEVTYFDKTESRFRRGQAYIENDQLRLKDGSPLSIKFEKQ